MVRSRRRALSATSPHNDSRARPAVVFHKDIIAIRRVARELQIFAGALADARADTLTTLLEPTLQVIPEHPTPLSAWIVRSLLVNVLHRIDAHFGPRPEPASSNAEALWQTGSIAELRDLFRKHLREVGDRSMPPASIRNSCGDSRIDRALDYIRAHCSSPSLALDDVSRFVRLSRWHFSRLLTRYLGMGFRDVVRGLRMERATVLLNEDVLTIKEISAQLGFVHPTELDRQFKQSFGVTPTEWRARHTSAGRTHTLL